MLVTFAGTHTLGTATVTPAMVTVNMPTPVTVNIPITDPELISSSVNLLQLGAPGTQPTILGVMQDTGNGVYSLQHVFTEPTTGQLLLEVSAAFKGSLLRVTANIPAIPVVQPLTFSDGTMGLTLNYPADWYSQQGTSSVIFSNVQQPSTSPSSSFFQVYYLSQVNPGFLPIEQWFAQFSQLAPFPPISVSSASITGHAGIIVTVPEVGAGTMIFLSRGANIIKVTYDTENQQFVGEYLAMLNSMTF